MKSTVLILLALFFGDMHADSLNLTQKYKIPKGKKIKSRYWQKYKSSSALVDKISGQVFLTGGNPNFSHIDRSIEFSGYFTEFSDKKQYTFDRFVIMNNSEIITPYKIPMSFDTSCKNNEMVFSEYPEPNSNKNLIFNYKKYFEEEIDTCVKTIFDRIDKASLVLNKTYPLSTGDKNKYFSDTIEQKNNATGFYLLSKKSDEEYILNFTVFMRSKPDASEKTSISIQSVPTP